MHLVLKFIHGMPTAASSLRRKHYGERGAGAYGKQKGQAIEEVHDGLTRIG
jgi:hypothetical protein